MHIEARNACRQSTLLRLVATAVLLTLTACGHLSDRRPTPSNATAVPRADCLLMPLYFSIKGLAFNFYSRLTGRQRAAR